MGKFEEFKDKYVDGYRCIYKEKDAKQGTTLHLKNFNTEALHTINTKNDMEIGQIEDFLSDIEKIKKRTGHDCHNT